MNSDTTPRKNAEDLQPGDVIVTSHEGREYEAVVCDVRHVTDGLIHADTGDGTATSIFFTGDVVRVRNKN